jgi:hypothetical protein
MIKIDDFAGMINIPDLYGDAPANQAVREKFDLFITEFTEQFLRDLFGDDYYATHSSDITDGTAAQWVTLRTYLVKPMRRYIYFNFIRHNTTQTAATGEIQANFENAVIVTNRHKLTEQWNRMSEEIARTIDYLQDNEATFTDYDYYDSLLPSGMHPLSKISSFQ